MRYQMSSFRPPLQSKDWGRSHHIKCNRMNSARGAVLGFVHNGILFTLDIPDVFQKNLLISNYPVYWWLKQNGRVWVVLRNDEGNYCITKAHLLRKFIGLCHWSRHSHAHAHPRTRLHVHNCLVYLALQPSSCIRTHFFFPLSLLCCFINI